MKFSIRSLAVFAFAAVAALGADPQLLSLIPPEAQVIGGVSVQSTAGSPFGQFLLSQMKQDDPRLARLITATGFDPRKDVRELMFASDTGAANGQGMIVALGVFNGPQIFTAAKSAESAVTTNYNGVDLLTSKTGRDALAFLDGSIAIAGKQAWVKAAIDRRKAAPAGLPPAVLAKVNELSSRYDVWLFSNAPVSGLAGAVPDRQVSRMANSNAMQSIEQTSGGVKFGTLVEVSGEAVARTEKDATALADVLRFMAGMLQMSRENSSAAQFASLLDTLQLKTDGKTMRFSVSIPQAELEKLLKPRRTLRRAAVSR